MYGVGGCTWCGVYVAYGSGGRALNCGDLGERVPEVRCVLLVGDRMEEPLK